MREEYKAKGWAFEIKSRFLGKRGDFCKVDRDTDSSGAYFNALGRDFQGGPPMWW
jgi:hypothetical protein